MPHYRRSPSGIQNSHGASGYLAFIVCPQTDDYPEELERVIQALLAGGREAAAELLAPIGYPVREVKPRAEPSESLIASIYQRDRFHCRYCGCRVIPTQIMRLISDLIPEEFPYHPNWRGGTNPSGDPLPQRDARSRPALVCGGRQ